MGPAQSLLAGFRTAAALLEPALLLFFRGMKSNLHAVAAALLWGGLAGAQGWSIHPEAPELDSNEPFAGSPRR